MKSLDCKYPVGNGINKPVFGTSKDGKTMNVSMSSSMGSMSSGPNLSAKYKYPRVSQSVPDAGKGQYE